MATGNSKDHPDLNPETAPDPDEDDLDDLDEMLDEFSPSKIGTATPAPSAPGPSGPGRPTVAERGEALNAEDELARQLQLGMADMLKELETNPDMAKQLEEMMAQFGTPLPSAQSTTPANTSGKSTSSAGSITTATGASISPAMVKAAEDNFQETIRLTMDRMKASSSSADAAASNPSAGDDDVIANLLRELQEANGGAEGEGDDTFSKMLLGMMEQLTNKEILYEPMKELDTKFPAWLQKKKGTLSMADEKRYTEQSGLVREIVQRFEKKGYSDGSAEDREYIVERMQKMQAAGAPPPDLVGDVDSNMINDLDAGCPQQ